ncbi:hypothetical protein A9R05_17080 [Burkholderia sp. KK1]|nr:hypothetical protein A9R05_17080 [Burkholderia sp. KK1]
MPPERFNDNHGWLPSCLQEIVNAIHRCKVTIVRTLRQIPAEDRTARREYISHIGNRGDLPVTSR